MTEQSYQSRIRAKILKAGGVCINGNYTTTGEADLQCGIMKDGLMLYVAVEVKTEFNYHRVMSAIDKHYNVIDKKKLKSHEVLQMAKIKETRKRGGLALVAYNFNQVMEYVNGTV